MLDIHTPTATVSIGAGADLTVTSIVSNTLAMGVGSRLDIKAISGGYHLASSSISPVPEPGTLALSGHGRIGGRLRRVAQEKTLNK